jgi:hypothetical protein
LLLGSIDSDGALLIASDFSFFFLSAFNAFFAIANCSFLDKDNLWRGVGFHFVVDGY